METLILVVLGSCLVCKRYIFVGFLSIPGQLCPCCHSKGIVLMIQDGHKILNQSLSANIKTGHGTLECHLDYLDSIIFAEVKCTQLESMSVIAQKRHCTMVRIGGVRYVLWNSVTK